MKIIAVLLLFVTAVSCFFNNFGNVANNFNERVGSIGSSLKSVPVLSNVVDFSDFAAQSGKTFATAAERNLREGLFKLRKGVVDSNNAAFASGQSTYQLAINAFADYTPTEFLKRLTGNRKSPQGDAKAKQHSQTSNIPTDSKEVTAFDWRQKGGVTPVKFQGECGSCWSFATTGAIEGHVFRKTGKLISLSEQNLVDCGKKDYGLDGCDGGFQEYAFEFVTEQKGIAVNEKYPYLDKASTCVYKNNIKGSEISGFATIPPKDEKMMKQAIVKLGPLACSINGLESLMLYKTGIYADEECNKGDVNHSILVVGFGVEKGQEYWIVKNSWDKSWGEDGYFRLPLGKNFCGIASECSYPIV